MKKFLPSLLPITAAALLLVPQISSAQSISWGNAVGQRCFDSQSEAVEEGWKFELGTFKKGFVPTQNNIQLWIENWEVLDKAEYNSDAGFFSSRAIVKRKGLAGSQAFIWIYNEQSYKHSSEWVLMTDRDGEGENDWVIPTASNEPTVRKNNWRVSTASEVIIGGANSLVGCGERNKMAKGEKSEQFQAHRLPEVAIAKAKDRKKEPRIPVVAALLNRVLLLRGE